MITLLFLDDYHVGDPLFLADLGRRLAKLGANARIVIVHRAGEAVSRVLEGSESGNRQEITERTIRETNQSLARRLIEEGVPAVSIQGSDRGLFSYHGSVIPADAGIQTAPIDSRMRGNDQLSTNTGWLFKMIATGSIPVISPLVLGINGVEPADSSACAVALSVAARAEVAGESLRGTLQAVLFCSTRKGGLFREGQRLDSVAVSDLDDHADTIDIEAAAGLVGWVDRLVATNSAGLVSESEIEGTDITDQSSS